jgi:predicted Zn-dependent protease
MGRRVPASCPRDCRQRDTIVSVAEGVFYGLGRMVGGTVRKAKWMWQSLAGSEADAARAEYEVGRDMAAVIRERMPCDSDVEVQAFLDGIAQQLARSVRNGLLRFRVTAIAEDHSTAFALPGGFIFVARSLVDLCDRDRDETAFVVAHEMAHVIRRHAINRLLRQTALSAASVAAPGRGRLAPWIRTVGVQWLEGAYSREHEFEADALGGMLMRAAGFDPAGAIRLLDRLRGLDQTPDRAGMGAYFSTHPLVEDRILNLRSRLR